jgi:hypothetical protein
MTGLGEVAQAAREPVAASIPEHLEPRPDNRNASAEA